MDEIRRMTDKQFRRAKKLIRRKCANYDSGGCLLLSDRYGLCPCPQLITYSLLCRYFRTAVLPDDAELYTEIMSGPNRKRCLICGRLFHAKSNRAVYCACCAEQVRRRKTRDRVRRHRQSGVTL